MRDSRSRTPCVLRVRDSKHGDQTISALQKIGRVELSRFCTHSAPLLIDLSLQEVCFAWVTHPER
jgi:hypothetical protein